MALKLINLTLISLSIISFDKLGVDADPPDRLINVVLLAAVLHTFANAIHIERVHFVPRCILLLLCLVLGSLDEIPEFQVHIAEQLDVVVVGFAF